MILFSLCFLFSLTACGKQAERQSEPASLEAVQESKDFETESSETEVSKEEETLPEDTDQIRVRLTFDSGEAIIRLEDNAAARDFLSKLPLTQTFEDFNSIEKICRLPDEIRIEDVEAGVDPDIADVTYYPAGPSFAVFFSGEGSSDQGGLICGWQ